MNHYPRNPVQPFELAAMSHAELLDLRVSVHNTVAVHEVECDDPGCLVNLYLDWLGCAVDRHLTASWTTRLLPELVRRAA